MIGNNHIPVLSTQCPKCNRVNVPRGKSHTLAMVCSGCSTYYHFGKWNDEEVQFLEKHEPIIPIGSKGKFEEITYEVMGFVVKRDQKYHYRWREYFLFNPTHGIAFLSEYDGHWTFIWPIEGNPKGSAVGHTFRHESKEFRLYQKYKAEIVFAQGEFFFDIFRLADITINEEYIAPPYLLGQELNKNSMLWYKGEYIESKEVAAAFKMDASRFPSKSGIGYTQPAIKVGFTDEALIKVCIGLVLLVIALQIIFSTNAQEKVVFQQTYYKSALPEKEKVFVTPSFELVGASKSLTVKVKAPVDNNWFYTDLSLINDQTGDEFNFSKEVAYYHGYEGGESWAEGSQIGEAFLSKIPGGQYHINIYPEFGSADSFTIWVTHDVSTPSNMFITLACILIFPIGYFIWKNNREKSRWSESDYSPYEE